MTVTAKRRAWEKEYNSRPEIKAKRKEWDRKRNSEPEVKAKAQARKKAYHATPEGRAKITAYNSLPAVMAKRLINTKRYVSTLEGRLRTLLTNARRNAKKRADKAVSITYEDLVELHAKQGGKCALTGWEMTAVTGQLTTISLDRIDNSRGYSIDNIHLVTRQANWAKNEWTVEQLITFCKAVTENHKLKDKELS